MKHIDTATEYQEHVERLVRNNRVRDGSSPQHVANVALVSIHQAAEETALTTSAWPYASHRIFPTDVIRYGGDEYPDGAESIREVAVGMLARDIATAQRGAEMREEMDAESE